MSFALITGATGHLGTAYANALAAEGNDLFLTGRDGEKLLTLSKRLSQEYGIKTLYFPCLLQDDLSRTLLFSEIEKKNVVFHTVVHVAGADIQKPFDEYTREKVLFQTRVNFEAAVDITHFVLSHRAPTLQILVVSSVSGLYPMPYFALYSATKGAEVQFFSALRQELKGKNCKVTCVLPGAMPTREDIKEQIKGQGLWGKIAAKPTSFVVRKSLTALRRGKRLCIPGFFNHGLQIAMKLLPTSLKIKMIGKRWKNIQKDAF